MKKLFITLLLSMSLFLTGCMEPKTYAMSEGQVLTTSISNKTLSVQIAYTNNDQYYISYYYFKSGDEELIRTLKIYDKVNVYYDQYGNIEAISKIEK